MFAFALPWIALACLAVWLGACEPAFASSTPGMLVAQPTTYKSPSGIYSLFVDPSERLGRSSATYRFTKNEEEVWSGEREYPEAIWYGFIKTEDTEGTVQSHLIGGVPVERLVLPEGCVNTPRCPRRVGGVQLGGRKAF